MEKGMNGDDRHSRSRSPSPGLNRSNSRGSMNRDGRTSSLVRRNAKQIRFYRNGDKFFRGLKLAVSTERYKEFDALCAELSAKMDLPTGAVRFVFDAESGKEVRDVSELEYGSSYVCGSAPVFKVIPGGYGKPHHSWSVNSKNPENKAITNWDRKVVQCQQSMNKRDFIKPKLVTIIKNGKPPQKKVTMLLNQKTALHLDQVLDHLSAKGTLGKVDKLCTCDCKQIRELRDLFNDDMIFIACCATEKFPEEGFEVDVHRKRPPWDFSTVPVPKKYVPSLPTEKHLTKVFTVHIHCLLAASMPAEEYRTPRSTARSSRARSVSPRLYLPQRPKSASPMRNMTPVPPRPKTAPRASSRAGSRPTQFSMKPLAPRKVSETTPMKAVSKPKAGSDKPVAIRPRRPMKPPENDSTEEKVEDVRAKHGYFVYVYNDQFRGDPGHADSRPTASVKPMFAVQVLEDDSNDKENSENKETSSTQDDLDKSDLKPLSLSVSPAGSLDAILPK